MGVKKQILKAAAYGVAPKLAFLANNPRKAAWATASTWAGKQVAERMLPERMMSQRMRPRTQGASLGRTAVRGLGAAALAAPLGWWLGRKVLERQNAEPGAR